MSETNRPLLTIDLGAISENYRLLRDRTRPAACCATIKADCYGLGMKEVAPTLYRAGCREFFVATVEEGIDVRRTLPSASIYILLGPARDDRDTYSEHKLIPVLNSLPQIEEWLARPATESGLPIALHADTGMARLGLTEEEILSLVDQRRYLERLNTTLFMSHLACADEPDHELNLGQLRKFSDLCEKMRPRLGDKARFSLASSSAIFLGPDYFFDMVRPGAALYGINPIPGQTNPMKPVVRLVAPILQVRTIDAGKCVGYGATHRFSRPTRVATIALGYADGILRSFSNAGTVHIGEVPAPIVGRVSMDLVTIDVGHVPEQLTRPGAMVEILGPKQGVDEFGRAGGTIGYEILTALGDRYRRQYLAGE